MNKGGFARNCELLLIHLNNLQNSGKSKKCTATTKYLSKSIGKSQTQTNRYIRALEQKGLIKRTTTGFKRNVVTKKPYKNRTIEVKCKASPHSKQILGIYFKKSLHGRTKNRMIKEVVYSKEFQLVNLGPQMPPQMVMNLELVWPWPKPERVKEKEMDFDEMNKLVEMADKIERQKKYYTQLEEKFHKLLFHLWDGVSPFRGETALERLANNTIDQFVAYEKEYHVYDTEQQKKEKAALWASNSTLRDGEYWITIYLGGEYPYETKFFNYIPHGKDSDYFKYFEQAFQEKK